MPAIKDARWLDLADRYRALGGTVDERWGAATIEQKLKELSIMSNVEGAAIPPQPAQDAPIAPEPVPEPEPEEITADVVHSSLEPESKHVVVVCAVPNCHLGDGRKMTEWQTAAVPPALAERLIELGVAVDFHTGRAMRAAVQKRAEMGR